MLWYEQHQRPWDARKGSLIAPLGTTWPELFQVKVKEVVSNQSTLSQGGKKSRDRFGFQAQSDLGTSTIASGISLSILGSSFSFWLHFKESFPFCGGKVSICSSRLTFLPLCSFQIMTTGFLIPPVKSEPQGPGLGLSPNQRLQEKEVRIPATGAGSAVSLILHT